MCDHVRLGGPWSQLIILCLLICISYRKIELCDTFRSTYVARALVQHCIRETTKSVNIYALDTFSVMEKGKRQIFTGVESFPNSSLGH